MNTRKQSVLWKPSVFALLGLSVLTLAGCGQSQKSADGGPGPNAADKAAQASLQQNAAQDAAKQAAAAKARAAAPPPSAASGAGTAPTGTTGQ